MLQSFSQFLPSTLGFGDNHARTATPSAVEENKQLGLGPHSTTAPNAPGPAHDDASELKKKRKEKPANETFIFVRPPPAKNNHPLNLQVQLVPPTSKDKNRVASDSSSRPTTPGGDGETGGSNLSRTLSTQSSQSAYSQNTSNATSSNASISSYASSTTSGRRMIIPLYSLQAHNVMTNTVVDAGTDAKVAKFKGRGLEVIGLCTLEPVEVWGDSYETSQQIESSVRSSIDTSSNAGHDAGISEAKTPTQATPTSPGFLMPNPSATTTPTPSGAKKMFGKMFKRSPRPGSSASAASPIGSSFNTAASSMTAVPGSPVFLDSPRTSLALPSSPFPGSPATSGFSTSTAAENTPALRPPILGITPTFASPTTPPIGRPNKYVWVVKRWMKGADTGFLALGGKVGSRLSGKDNLATGPGALVEVRFEWSRGRTSAGRKRVRRGDSVGSGGELGAGPGRKDKDRLSPEKAGKENNRLSMISHTTSTTDSQSHSPPAEAGNDSGDESDPEDSETPWTCALAVKRIPVPPPASFPSSGTPSPPADPGIRIKVGTLSPTPHHPKVVSMLKIPYPLPDIEVDRVVVRRRTPNNNMSPGNPGAGLVLTAEEIKDVISCTGLWLVVREGFGGVGRVGRKGDGWRLRA